MDNQTITRINNTNLKKVYKAKKFRYFTGNQPNMLIIRSANRNAGKFDDLEIQWQYDGTLSCISIFACTADPSDISLESPVNTLGCAILPFGQQMNVWKVGIHRYGHPTAHEALVQCNPIIVIRSIIKDGTLNWETELRHDTIRKYRGGDNSYISDYIFEGRLVLRLNTGMFGVDNHRASAYNILDEVGLYSQGCVVINEPNRFKEVFMKKILDYNDGVDIRYDCTIISEDEFNKIYNG